MAEIAASDTDKPTVTVDFWTGCSGKSFMGSTVHYIYENKLKSHVLFFVEVEPPHSSELTLRINWILTIIIKC